MHPHIKYLAEMPKTLLKYIFNQSKFVFVDGFPHTKNFGDALGTPIVEFLSGKKVLPSKNISRFVFHSLGFKNYAVVGSILQWVKNNCIVWGAGFISDKNCGKISKPASVLAVRGPKSREIYLNHNIQCPEIYGDPALLLPLMYYPRHSKRFKFGIIPHYYDYDHPWVSKMRKRNDVLVIDLMVFTNYQLIVDQILSCENILSTSLHGIIVADAYRIPNLHITLSDKIFGGDFKFQDYYLSVNRKQHIAVSPILLDIDTIEIEKEDIKIDLRKLIAICPFVTSEKREVLIKMIEDENKFFHLKG
ncbi:polysaccharide pyruvyl transferase family protein [Sphingobacterium sp. SGG-5]|uniref:polysaccharide pyruvyl transferase family protein n=1 Tax=Sphingobacterium sp. SGG-5 TaxID=2710881 RepID=UPI0013EB88EF|nr:polysaccharide pyruvyl transferase family protein [Sphingobacterium sp. SGG-5]NGM63425.1 polysaccharide pyruvyl transferase family protein [Sphingobacterium sp. SGG-5]